MIFSFTDFRNQITYTLFIKEITSVYELWITVVYKVEF